MKPHESDTEALTARSGHRRMKAILVLAAVAAFIAAPWFTDGFGGFDPDLFPIPQERPPVQPAGYAFGIWGLIYAWLVLHAGHGLLMRAEDAGWDAGRWPLIVSLGVGAGWIAAANASAPLATVMIWAMLLGALGALALTRPARGGAADRWLGPAPLAVYAGWLTAASWVAVGFMLGGYGVMAPVWAAALSLTLAVVMAVAVQLWLGRCPEYGVTVIWALVAVILANLGGAWGLVLLGGLGLAAVAVAVVAVWRPDRLPVPLARVVSGLVARLPAAPGGGAR